MGIGRPAGLRALNEALLHHPWGVIPPHLGRENIDLRLARTTAQNTAQNTEQNTDVHARGAWEVEHD